MVISMTDPAPRYAVLEGFDIEKVNVTLLERPDQVPAFLAFINQDRRILGLDIETNALPWSQGGVSRLVQFGDTTEGWAIPAEGWASLITFVLINYERDIVLHNGNYDIMYLWNDFGWVPRWDKIHDTMFMSKVMNRTTFNGLKPLSEHLIDARAGIGEKLLQADFDKYGWWWDTVPIELPSYWVYGALDPVLTAVLFEVLGRQLDESGARRAYLIERAAMESIWAVQKHGMHVDRPYCDEQITKLTAENQEIAAKLRAAEGDEWSISSGDSMVALLQKKGIPLYKRTESGAKLALDKEVLEEFSWMDPLLGDIRLYRDNARMVSAYYQNFLNFSSDEHPFVHAEFKQMQAKTTRMSVIKPALQQIPSRSEKSIKVRRSVVARPGHVLIACDLSQIEIRLFAEFAGDPELVEAIRQGLDVHSYVASKAFHVTTPTKQQRTFAKQVGLGALYGAGAARLSATLGVSPEEGQEIYDAVMTGFPAIKRYQAATERWAKTTLVNGVARIPNHYGGIMTASEDDGLYVLGNYRIQSSAALYFKEAMLRCMAAGLRDFMTCFVHDEVVLEVPKSEDLDEVRHTVKEAMETIDGEFTVPLTADVSDPQPSWDLCK